MKFTRHKEKLHFFLFFTFLILVSNSTPLFAEDENKETLAQNHYEMGLTYYEIGLLAEAFAELKKALKAKPDFAKAHLYLGLIYADKGYIESAVKEFTEAVKIDPNNVEAHFNLGFFLGF